MTYKFFTNKHDLIDESQEKLQSKSLKEVLADDSWDEKINESWEEIQANESWDERIENERINELWEEIQADDLDEKTETFQVSIQWEFWADE